MKKGLTTFLLIFISFFARTQVIAGNWRGTLNAGAQKLNVIFHIKTDSTRRYQTSFDSPDQGTFGISCSETHIRQDSLEMLIRMINGGYVGKWDGKDRIAGYFFQNGMHFAMNLSRAPDTVAVLIRPQTPKPPFPYNNEEVEFDNQGGGIHYSGTLTYPRSDGPFPAAILITGSGQQDRDETLFGHKPFAVIADALTRRGYAVLRVDDRQVGHSTGDVSMATSQDFSMDVENSFHYLSGRKEINPKKIGLIGHSEGGLIAPMVASRNDSIYFMILLAGAGLKGADLMEWQNEFIARSQGMSPAMSGALRKISGLLIQASLSSTDSGRQAEAAWNSFLAWEKNTDSSIVKALGMSDAGSTKKLIRSELQRMNKPWFRYFLQTDPAVYLSKLHCRVLALNGSKDIQVVPDQNLAAIDSALKTGGNKNYSIKKLTGLNHLFQHCQTCTVEEYGQLEETFAPEALQLMEDWLDKNVK